MNLLIKLENGLTIILSRYMDSITRNSCMWCDCQLDWIYYHLRNTHTPPLSVTWRVSPERFD